MSILWTNMTKNQWDKYARIFDDGIGEGNEDLHQNHIDPVIFDYLGGGKYETIVDAGCGNGYLLNRLSRFSNRLVGLDYSEELLNFAKSRTSGNDKVKLILADLMKKIPLEDGSSDVVIANMVLQYLPSLNVFASESHRVLKNKGLLIIIVDHPSHQLFARAQELAGKRDPHFKETGSYFESGMRMKNSLWNKAVLEYYHRPINEYVNPFLEYFRLIKIDEKTQNGEVPRLLALKFVK